MKNVYTKLLTIVLALSFMGCGSDNSFDGENGLLSSGVNKSGIDKSLSQLYTNVILTDINSSYSQSLILIQSVKDLNEMNSTATLLDAQTQFKELALSYKRVESAYVAGRESADMRDIADFYLEQFIFNSKGDTLFTELDNIYAGVGSLFKNSHQGITALEYTLFDKNVTTPVMLSKLNTVRLASAITMAEQISLNLKLVKDYYENESTFLDDGDTAIALVLNVLVDNAFKLREKRIGDPAGYTIKFINKSSVLNLEYHKSVNSLEAIKVILQTHKRIMQEGMSEIAVLGSASSEAETIISIIDDALGTCNSYGGSLESELVSSKTEALYERVSTLQTNYTALINALNFQQDLLEADGD